MNQVIPMPTYNLPPSLLDSEEAHKAYARRHPKRPTVIFDPIIGNIPSANLLAMQIEHLELEKIHLQQQIAAIKGNNLSTKRELGSILSELEEIEEGPGFAKSAMARRSADFLSGLKRRLKNAISNL